MTHSSTVESSSTVLQEKKTPGNRSRIKLAVLCLLGQLGGVLKRGSGKKWQTQGRQTKQLVGRVVDKPSKHMLGGPGPDLQQRAV